MNWLKLDSHFQRTIAIWQSNFLIFFSFFRRKKGGLLKNQLQVLANVEMKVYGMNENSKKEDTSAETN